YIDTETGRKRRWTIADTPVELPIKQNKTTSSAATDANPSTFRMRQITTVVDNGKGQTRQIHLLTTRRDMHAGELLHRMGSRWRQENHFRYARMHFDLDAHDAYDTSGDDPTRPVPNPAKKQAYTRVQNTRARL